MHIEFTCDLADVYASMLEKLEEIEQALDHHDCAPIKQFSRDLDMLLEKIQHLDGQQTSPPNNTHRLAMEEILKKNKVVTARLRDFLALQRIELVQIKQGRETAKSYASYRAARTGSIINSTN